MLGREDLRIYSAIGQFPSTHEVLGSIPGMPKKKKKGKYTNKNSFC